MATSNDVAVVALVVAFFALVVALGQLSQQFLNTAEGYRRCKAEVIGAWATRTHRKWHWYEFRFETKYTVPDIDILSTSQWENRCNQLKGSKKGPYHLNTNLKDNTAEEIYYTVHPRTSDADNELLVSWIPFLRSLHRVYNHYAATSEASVHTPHRQSRRERLRETIHQKLNPVDVELEPGNQTTASKANELQLLDAENGQRTSVAITYHELSWDFVPSDVVRPLAMTHLGPL